MLLIPISICQGESFTYLELTKKFPGIKTTAVLCIVSVGDPGEPPPSLPLPQSFSNDDGAGKKNVT